MKRKTNFFKKKTPIIIAEMSGNHNGSLKQALKIVKEASKLNSNIHFHEAVSQTEIINVTSSADVGLSLITNDSLNHDYCLPNKVFEYIHSGILCIQLSD